MKKAVTMIAIIFLTVVTVSGMLLYYYLGSFSRKVGEDNKEIIQIKEVEYGEAFNILVLGVDIGVADSKNSPKRSDTMMVLHYDPETCEAAVVSIPRDTRVKINGSYEKINAAHAFGGTDLSIKSVENLLGININYYVEINYEGFRKIIDAIGGVDVVIPYDMKYDDKAQDLHINFKKGQQVHLDGKKAEEFVRWRKNNDGTGYADGDLGRIRTQQEFMVKVLEKIKSPAIIPNIVSIARILPEYIDTNMDPLAMISLSKDIPRLSIDSVQKFTVQGESKIIDGIWYFVYEPSKNKDMIALLGGGVSYSDIDKSKIKIQVFNGSGITGAASRIRQELESKGYKVTGVGNISGVKFDDSYVIDKTLKGNNAAKVASDLHIANIEKKQDTLSSTDIIVILGSDVNNMLADLSETAPDS